MTSNLTISNLTSPTLEIDTYPNKHTTQKVYLEINHIDNFLVNCFFNKPYCQ